MVRSLHNGDPKQTAVDVVSVEKTTSVPWVHTVDGQFVRLQKEGNFPEFAGDPGRLVLQSFTVGGDGSVPVPTIGFPHSYAPGTTPQVFLQIDDEVYRGKSCICCLESPVPGTPRVTNTSFTFRANYADSDGIGTTAVPWTLHVLAIGYM